MKISIIGTGAVGSYYGIMLANAGHHVDFLLRSDYEYVKSNGLKLYSNAHKDIILPSVNAYKSTKEMPKSDIVIVALKTTQNNEVLPKILPDIVDNDSIVILVQNGLGMEEDLSAQLPSLQLAGGAALISSHKTQKGTVIHQDYGNLDLGSYNLQQPSLLDNFSGQLISSGVPSSHQSLKKLRWKKLVWNMTFNGLSVVLDKTTNQILDDPKDLKRCKIIMKEVIEAAKACDVLLPENFDQEMIAFTQKMIPYAPSMKLDYDFGRPMELQYIYEKPILFAREAGYNMVYTEELFNELVQLEKV